MFLGNSYTPSSGVSSTNHNQYHSSVNPYLSNNYSNYGSSSYYPSSSNTSMTTSGDHYSNYSQANGSSNREDKWNELDSMLGAQSALLSRLESDFVANRKKSNPGGFNTVSSTATSGSTSAHQLKNNNSSTSSAYNPSNRYSSSSSQLLSKLPAATATTTTSISDMDILNSSYIPSRYRTPKKTIKYNTTKIDENDFEPFSVAVPSNTSSNANSHATTFNTPRYEISIAVYIL